MSHQAGKDAIDLQDPHLDDIRDLLRELCPGTEVTSVRPGPKSYSNRLWLADTDEGALLVRIPGREAGPAYVRGSIAAARRASEAGVPAPRLRAFAPETGLGHPAVVQEFQPGESASAALKRDPGAVTSLAATLGDWIGVLHGIRREAFGGVLTPEAGADWGAVVHSKVSRSLSMLEDDALPCRRTDVEAAFATAIGDLPEDIPASLVHGDLYFDNLLVRDGRASCLLDFEHARYYDRFADFGKVNELLFEWWPESKEPFLESYWSRFPPVPSDIVRLRLGIGLYELSQLAYFRKWQEDLVPVYRDRLHGWLTDRPGTVPDWTQ